jgi:phenylpropionate dioxygenase-like ring-hydroxylating dioxygenase large terminal subunit
MNTTTTTTTTPTTTPTTTAPAPTLPTPGLAPTLSSVDYASTEVFDLERRRIFHAGWMYVCHIEGIPIGTRRAFDIAGEGVIVTRDRDGDVHAFANVCRHRGSELCPVGAEASKGNIRCGYHAWTYGLDGALVATPRVDDEFDRDQYGLWPRHAEVWNGLVFVSVATDPPALTDWLTEWTPGADGFDHLPVADYRLGARTETLVNANWKILVENYNECLHCAVVHPELVNVIPVYRTGNVIDPDRDDDIVDFRAGARALTIDGESSLSPLPGVTDEAQYSGVAYFPNLEFDLTPTNLALTALFPIAPDKTLVVAEYLFAAADTDRPDFDPSAEVDFNEMVGAQDFAVCEMVQRGVSSRAFAGGGLTAKDAYVIEFTQRYLDIRDRVDTH